jgi:hypothetical protein
MRHFYSRLTPIVIHNQAQQVLSRCLEWKPFRESVTAAQLVDLTLFMAAMTASLSDIVRRFFVFSHETARRAMKATLPDRDRLVAGLVNSLHDVLSFSRLDRRRYWNLAIDIHNKPYYGQRTADVVGGPKKKGTKWSFAYATAVLLHKGRRYTVGLCLWTPRMTMAQIVRILLDQIAEKGLKIRGVALDSGFDSGDVLLLLQERRLAYTVPMRRAGKGSNARNRLFEGRHRRIRWAEWKTDRTHRPVRTRTFLWKRGPRTMLFAFSGWSGDSAKNIYDEAMRMRRLYRQRFGIETSYRQKNQAEAFTTSKDPVYRLLLQGVAYLLRQIWVMLTEHIARVRHIKPSAWVSDLTFAILLNWLEKHLEDLNPKNRSIPLDSECYAQ